MKETKPNTRHYLQDHWYLGFLGLIGIYKFPNSIDFFMGQGSAWDLLDLLWLLWLLYFLPIKKNNQ